MKSLLMLEMLKRHFIWQKIYIVSEFEVEKMKKYLDIVIIGKDALEITKTEAVELRKYLFK